MEFWGVEVKPGESFKVSVDDDKIIHLSQACLGETKKVKGNESVPIFVKFNNEKLVLGHLSSEKFPQLSFDLVFEKEFELLHNWKNGSVYFAGYKTITQDDSPDDFSDLEDDSEEDITITPADNGKAALKVDNAKPASDKANEPISEQPSKDIKSMEVDEEDDESDEDDDDERSDSDEEEDDSSDEDAESDEEDEKTPTPKKADIVKKRSADSSTKTPASKKAKAATPQKTDGKKGVHTATPHPSKKAEKAPANGTPKSGGEFTCKSCSKTFSTGSGLESHTKAKHGGVK
ncbi:hypothetical protein CFOL_v3_05313 [Cephalotus follicularis]|uniref:C2H2-type domain-containing protein n=1 Tax=Cephalotus follicularis TaxID=3775 RepID=A0A1Q3B1A3_CEPFO|nr:hypothetical protein CFOL_v3_05313 [Cephalotus follicularis]